MSLLLESLRIQNRQIDLPDYHNRRMNRSRQLLLGATDEWDVREIISLPEDLTEAVYKCRLVYDTVVRSIEFVPYHKRPICSLKLVSVGSEFEYDHKYAGRAALNDIYAQRGDCDDVLIVRDGYVTDTSFSNIALFDGTTWYTPARPLLRGVRVASLIERGVLHEKDIHVHDLPRFHRLLLLNAMLQPGEAIEVGIENIV